MLINTISQLAEEKKKHSRYRGGGKKNEVYGLLSILNSPKNKLGRQPKLERIDIYEKAIKNQEHGLAKTNKQALVAALTVGGMAEWKAKEKIKNNRLEKGLSEYKQSKKIRN